MAAAVNQKDILKRYLSGPSSEKKKKKKKNYKGKGLIIVDDSIDISKIRPLDGDDYDVYGEGEDAPQVAGIIDERPEELKKLDQAQTLTKWKVITQDDGFNQKLEIKEVTKNIKEVQKENEVVFGKLYSDSEDDNKNDSDASPPRKNSKNEPKNKNSVQNNNDLSPPRKYNKEKTDHKVQNDDLSPPRKNNKEHMKESKAKDRTRKPSRWGGVETPQTREYIPNSDSDTSPPRKRPGSNFKNSDERSKERKSSKRSPSPRKGDQRKSKYDSDSSPPRKSRKDSPKPHSSRNKRDRKKTPDSDMSPPRKSKKDDRKHKKRRSDSDESPPRRKRTGKAQTPDSDQSPPRKRQRSPKQSDSDQSPPRRKTNQSPQRKQKQPYSKSGSDSDMSPPRRPDRKRNSDSPPPSNKKMARTLEGKLAGLQDARQLRNENEAFRKREEEAFKTMTDDVSGRNAKAVSRKSKRESSAERQKQREKEERQKIIDEKYKKWSKGIKQIEAQEERHQSFLHEASKPLARYKDDTDLEADLKSIERADDPMLQYIKEKKRERGELGPEKPMYKGNFPPNRFNIRPGYRWDGVDRSNGYEKKYFENRSKKKAEEEDYYKWSSADM